MQFIGDKKVKGTLELPDEKLTVMFKDGSSVDMNKNLFDILVHKEKRDGNVTDMARLVLATKFLSELSDYGLEYYMISQIGNGMDTLAHNLREQKISKMFNCNGTNDISISTLLEQDEEKA